MNCHVKKCFIQYRGGKPSSLNNPINRLLLFFSVPEAVDVWMHVFGEQTYVVWNVSALDIICPHNKAKYIDIKIVRLGLYNFVCLIFS